MQLDERLRMEVGAMPGMLMLFSTVSFMIFVISDVGGLGWLKLSTMIPILFVLGILFDMLLISVFRFSWVEKVFGWV